ncbi:VOC family protein [Gordonia sp. HY002]|uniref:VOC family protein n=1 Tax=Gordonia zhenghanii TaxID=2911516 RepID=UPI001EEFA092|nr:VOC family protein [Gordonia zhenghanii]MCF8571096.1 VOC family protein [Gordonia zhenghanii]MCF8604025.1 VOC family protein [Gordonia zhenghanii]
MSVPPSPDIQITFDAHDPRGLSQFWCAALGYVVPGPPGVDSDPDDPFAAWDEFLARAGIPVEQWNSNSAAEDPAGVRSRLFFQQVPEGKVAKNRIHLDVRAAPGLVGDERMSTLEARATALVALGASRTRRVEPAPPMGHGHIVMADPEGNEFCLD